MNYAQIDAALKASFQRENAAFLHGFWHGLNASHGEWSLKQWLDALVEEFDISSIPAELLKAFQLIHTSSEAQIQADALSLQLLLPDDEESIQIRALALQHWCQGYLYGLGLGPKVTNWKSLPTELREHIEDITQISQLDENSVSESEEDESDFINLVEYVRLTVGHIADELRVQTAPTLH
jgi:uncharacterized protein YgfB (UPF0149 family)